MADVPGHQRLLADGDDRDVAGTAHLAAAACRVPLAAARACPVLQLRLRTRAATRNDGRRGGGSGGCGCCRRCSSCGGRNGHRWEESCGKKENSNVDVLRKYSDLDQNTQKVKQNSDFNTTTQNTCKYSGQTPFPSNGRTGKQ